MSQAEIGLVIGAVLIMVFLLLGLIGVSGETFKQIRKLQETEQKLEEKERSYNTLVQAHQEVVDLKNDLTQTMLDTGRRLLRIAGGESTDALKGNRWYEVSQLMTRAEILDDPCITLDEEVADAYEQYIVDAAKKASISKAEVDEFATWVEVVKEIIAPLHVEDYSTKS